MINIAVHGKVVEFKFTWHYRGKTGFIQEILYLDVCHSGQYTLDGKGTKFLAMGVCAITLSNNINLLQY